MAEDNKSKFPFYQELILGIVAACGGAVAGAIATYYFNPNIASKSQETTTSVQAAIPDKCKELTAIGVKLHITQLNSFEILDELMRGINSSKYDKSQKDEFENSVLDLHQYISDISKLEHVELSQLQEKCSNNLITTNDVFKLNNKIESIEKKIKAINLP